MSHPRQYRSAFLRVPVLIGTFLAALGVLHPIRTLHADEWAALDEQPFAPIDSQEPKENVKPLIGEPPTGRNEGPSQDPSKKSASTDAALQPTGESPVIAKIDGATDNDLQADSKQPDPFPDGLLVRWLIPVNGFGLTDVELSTVDHRPRFTDHTLWDLSIPFGVHFVTERGLGLPPELYDIQIEGRWVQPIGEQFGFDVSVIPGFFTDFDSSQNNGFRVSGHLIGTYRYSDDLQLALGAMYLGRQDVPILPAGGLVWNIRPETQLELLMPNPRITQKVSTAQGNPQLVYAGFELFGGNSWAVSHFNTTQDTVTYRDFRFVVGCECGKPGSLRDTLEIGYAFARTVEFKNSPEIQHPGGTLLLQWVGLY